MIATRDLEKSYFLVNVERLELRSLNDSQCFRMLTIPYSLKKFVILIFVRKKIFVQVYSNPDEFPVSLIFAI